MTEDPQYKIYNLLVTRHGVHPPTKELDEIVAICRGDSPEGPPLTRSEKLSWLMLRYKTAIDMLHNCGRDPTNWETVVNETVERIEELMK